MNKEEEREYNRLYYEKNSERIKLRNKLYRDNHKDDPDFKLKKKECEKRHREKNKQKISMDIKIKRKEDKYNILTYYSNWLFPKCVCCNIDMLTTLSLDHINGNGIKHRKIIHNHMYRDILNNNFPPEYKTLCYNCNSGKHVNKKCPHKFNNNEMNMKLSNLYYKYIRLPILNKFSNNNIECVNCGEKNPLFLTIDHIDGNGHKHIKTFKNYKQYAKWLKEKASINDFKVLCHNCNIIKYRSQEDLIKFGKTQKTLRILKYNPLYFRNI